MELIPPVKSGSANTHFRMSKATVLNRCNEFSNHIGFFSHIYDFKSFKNPNSKKIRDRNASKKCTGVANSKGVRFSHFSVQLYLEVMSECLVRLPTQPRFKMLQLQTSSSCNFSKCLWSVFFNLSILLFLNLLSRNSLTK